MAPSDGGADSGSPSPERVADLVGSLATVMRQSEVTELDLELGGVSIRLRRPARGDDLVDLPPTSAAEPDLAAPNSASHVISAPMVGTFYAAPTPSGTPFVAPGDEVSAGQTIGIIEAMKIMNEITADRGGVVQELLVGNAQPVEYGSPLMRIGISLSERL